MAATTTEIFGSMVFNDHVMKERLPSATYKSLHETIRRGAPAGRGSSQRGGQRHEGLGH